MAAGLFLERANRVASQQVSLARDAVLLNKICVGLQGIPLALELAAARLRSVSLAHVANLLDDQMKLLRAVDRTHPDGVRTMESAIRASYDAISEKERQVFRQLCVFPTSFSLDQATQLLGRIEPIDDLPVIDALGRLVDSSLLFVAPAGPEEFRYGMFEAIRQFGLAQLTAEREIESTEQAFVDVMARLMERAFDGIGTGDRPRWMEMLNAESDHWRHALQICRDADQYASLVFCVASYWSLQQLGRETAFWLRKVIDQRAETSPHRLARALAGLGIFHWEQCENEIADAYASEAIVVAEASGDMDLLARALNTQALVYRQACRFEDAYHVATKALDAALSLSASRLVPVFQVNLGRCAALCGRYVEARDLISTARATFVRRGLPKEVSFCDYALAGALWRSGAFEESRDCFFRAFPVMVVQNDYLNAGWAFQDFLLMCMCFNDARSAANLVGIVRMIEKRTQNKILFSADGETERTVARAKEILGDTRWNHIVEESQGWDLSKAVDYVLCWDHTSISRQCEASRTKLQPLPPLPE